MSDQEDPDQTSPIPQPPVAPAGFAQTPPQPPYPSYSGAYPYAVGPVDMPGGYGPPPKNNMGLSIGALVVGALLGGIITIVTGVVAVVMASQVEGKWRAGDFAGATTSARRARTWAITTYVLSAVLAVAVFLFLVFVGLEANNLR